MTGVDKQRPVFLIAVCFVCGLDLGSIKMEKKIERYRDRESNRKKEIEGGHFERQKERQGEKERERGERERERERESLVCICPVFVFSLRVYMAQ